MILIKLLIFIAGYFSIGILLVILYHRIIESPKNKEKTTEESFDFEVAIWPFFLLFLMMDEIDRLIDRDIGKFIKFLKLIAIDMCNGGAKKTKENNND